jgi:hypothetical protein
LKEFEDQKNSFLLFTGKQLNKVKSAKEQFKSKSANSQFDLEETYDNLVSNMSHKTEDVISFLETKLADLKKENAKLQK